MNSEAKKEIIKHIENGEIKSALNKASRLKSSKKNGILNLLSRYNLLIKKKNKGLISEADSSVEENSIAYALLKIINEKKEFFLKKIIKNRYFIIFVSLIAVAYFGTTIILTNGMLNVLKESVFFLEKNEVALGELEAYLINADSIFCQKIEKISLESSNSIDLYALAAGVLSDKNINQKFDSIRVYQDTLHFLFAMDKQISKITLWNPFLRSNKYLHTRSKNYIENYSKDSAKIEQFRAFTSLAEPIIKSIKNDQRKELPELIQMCNEGKISTLRQEIKSLKRINTDMIKVKKIIK